MARFVVSGQVDGIYDRDSNEVRAPARVSKVSAFTQRVLSAINDLMLDILAAVARKDYEDRRRRVAQGQAKAKAQGRYSGRPAKTLRRTRVSHACSTPACHGHKYKIHSSAVARRSQRSPSECARRKPPRRPALSSLPFDVGEREPPMEAECGHWIEMRAPSR
jgi:hypothetical protein